MVSKRVVKHETFIIIGIIMISIILSKLLFGTNIDSDWFWLMAAIALTVEGAINLKQQNQFNDKYKVVSKRELLRFEEFKKSKKKK